MDDLHKMHAFMNDFWQFIKTHFTADEHDEQFWADTIGAVSALAKKYDNHPAVVQTMIGYMDYLEIEGCGRDREEVRRKKWSN